MTEPNNFERLDRRRSDFPMKNSELASGALLCARSGLSAPTSRRPMTFVGADQRNRRSWTSRGQEPPRISHCQISSQSSSRSATADFQSQRSTVLATWSLVLLSLLSILSSAHAFVPVIRTRRGYSFLYRQTPPSDEDHFNTPADSSGDKDENDNQDRPIPPTALNGKSNNMTFVPRNGISFKHDDVSATNQQLQQRVTQLEDLVAKQAMELRRLKAECEDLTEAAAAFAKVVELLRASGLSSDHFDMLTSKSSSEATTDESASGSASGGAEAVPPELLLDEDADIFGKVPSDVLEAADAAGAAILAALLAGQQRLLVDVRDAELTSNPETLVQLIELAVLPVAAGLEGLQSQRNRLKLVFPTIKQLHDYRKTMALAAPEVVALSTLNLGPVVEPEDNLVVLVAPSPDDEEGCQLMNQLLQIPPHGLPSSDKDGEETQGVEGIRQPVVVLNPHMAPMQGPAASYEVAYHLRLLSVQYSSEAPSSFVQRRKLGKLAPRKRPSLNDFDRAPGKDDTVESKRSSEEEKDALVDAAMEHARQEPARNRTAPVATTRAMVIRAYPNPWHVFVDTSPDTDAEFIIAGTFDQAPSAECVQLAIMECIEGSEREDELVAQQMQEALEAGQLDRVTQMLGLDEKLYFDDEDEIDDDAEEIDPWGLFDVDSV